MAEPRYHFDIVQPYYGNDTPSVTLADITAKPMAYFNGGDMAWMMMSGVLVFLMIPGVAFYYAGAYPQRMQLYMAWLPLMTAAVVGVEWYCWGHAIMFSNSPTFTNFWGGADGLGLVKVLLEPVPATIVSDGYSLTDGPYLPEILYSFYEAMFACFTATLVCSGAAYRDRPSHFLIFITIWSQLVYAPIARWTWDSQGWAKLLGSLDFAGGSAVHINAGVTVGAYCLFHTKLLPLWEAWAPHRAPAPESLPEAGIALAPLPTAEAPQLGAETHDVIEVDEDRGLIDLSPSSFHYMILGTMLLWVGWFGFNGGSALGANPRAASACMSTFLAPCFGAVANSILGPDGLLSARRAQKNEAAKARRNARSIPVLFSVKEFCNGAVMGLVAITPAAGFVPHYVAPVFGVLPCAIAYFCYGFSEYLQDDQAVLVVHGVAGLVGMFLTGLFVKPEVVALDGAKPAADCPGGPVWGHDPGRLGTQVWVSCVVIAYAFFGTLGILCLMEPLAWLMRGRKPRNVTDEDTEDRWVLDPQAIFEARSIPPDSRRGTHKEDDGVVSEDIQQGPGAAGAS